MITRHLRPDSEVYRNDLLAGQTVLFAASGSYRLHLVCLVELRVNHDQTSILIDYQCAAIVIANLPTRILSEIKEKELIFDENDQGFCHVQIHSKLFIVVWCLISPIQRSCFGGQSSLLCYRSLCFSLSFRSCFCLNLPLLLFFCSLLGPSLLVFFLIHIDKCFEAIFTVRASLLFHLNFKKL